jgi:oligogalacturonide lyase
MHTFGFTRPDNSEIVEHDFSYHCTHFTSYGLDYALGDGTPANVQPWFSTKQRPFLMLFRHTDNGYEGPRVLAFHRSTFNEQFNHPHAQFTSDGSKVLFTSDVGGYSNIYMVEVGAFEELPWVSECSVEWV